jgi:uncharacterized protein (DUF1330 family)
MPAYVICQVEVTDPAVFSTYLDAAPDVIATYGGRFVVRGGDVQTLEGDWSPSRLVVIEFPDMERARAWHASPEYQELAAVRARSSRASLVAIEGFAGPAA